MKPHSRIIPFYLALLLSLLIGCTSESNELNSNALQATAVSIVQQTASQLSPSQLPTVPPLSTPTPLVTKVSNTPTVTDVEFSATPSATSTPIASPTGEAKILMTGDTNCREGPSTHYGFVTLLKSGQTANVVGRDREGYYWVVDNPNGEGECWVWNVHTSPVGSLSAVPIIRAPSTRTPTRTPTITPKPLASIRYFKTISCEGKDAIIIRIYNYSRRDLQSWRARIFDFPGKIPQVTVGSNSFSHKDDECQQTVSTIGYRMDGYAVILYNEHSAVKYLVEFEVCTEPGKNGDCLFYGFYLNNPDITPTPTPTKTATPTPTETP